MNEFSEWINSQLQRKGWHSAELARRAGISKAQLSYVLNGQSRPGLDFCLGVARAVGVPAEHVLRRAGLLPSLPPPVEEEREVVGILRTLPQAARQVLVTMVRALSGGQTPTPAVGEGDDYLIPELLDEFRQVPDDWKPVVVQQVTRFRRLAELPQARLIGEEEERLINDKAGQQDKDGSEAV